MSHDRSPRLFFINTTIWSDKVIESLCVLTESTRTMAHLNGLQDCIRLSSGKSKVILARQTLIFFLPGNPGFVEYYRNFLRHVHVSLQHAGVTVYGASHIGFEMRPSRQGVTHDPPYSLQEVIGGVQHKLIAEARRMQEESQTSEPIQVVLMGHSVGSYMLLEVMTWWRAHSATSLQDKNLLQIAGGVCLFPTIVDIAKSPRGKVMSHVLALPFLPSLAQLAALLLSSIPLCLWNWAATLTPGATPSAHYVAVTEAVIKSNSGMSVRQAAFMAHDEMLSIKHDKWHPAQIWGARSEAETEQDLQPAKLFFYWGENDYWVDNEVRDRLIRERVEGGVGMRVDEYGMDHCFSLNEEHGKVVAEQVAAWVDGIL